MVQSNRRRAPDRCRRPCRSQPADRRTCRDVCRRRTVGRRRTTRGNRLGSPWLVRRRMPGLQQARRAAARRVWCDAGVRTGTARSRRRRCGPCDGRPHRSCARDSSRRVPASFGSIDRTRDPSRNQPRLTSPQPFRALRWLRPAGSSSTASRSRCTGTRVRTRSLTSTLATQAAAPPSTSTATSWPALCPRERLRWAPVVQLGWSSDKARSSRAAASIPRRPMLTAFGLRPSRS
jgi:hypothetical protein